MSYELFNCVVSDLILAQLHEGRANPTQMLRLQFSYAEVCAWTKQPNNSVGNANLWLTETQRSKINNSLNSRLPLSLDFSPHQLKMMKRKQPAHAQPPNRIDLFAIRRTMKEKEPAEPADDIETVLIDPDVERKKNHQRSQKKLNPKKL